MKFLFINTQFILFCVLVHAQHAEVKLPGTVKNKFESEFVNASAVSWKSLSQSGNYEAEFMDRGARKRVRYNDKGSILFSEINILPNQLAQNVKYKVDKDFAGYDIEQISQIETNKRIFIRIRLGKKTDRYEVEFELSGKIKSKRRLGRIYREDDDEDDDDHEHHERRHKEHDEEDDDD